ncbi:Uncharacterised protein [uncultured archaeon]|nr:Uncharacterised protein [uncultured archaeon]
MTKGLIMRLLVEGEEKVRIDAVTEITNAPVDIKRDIFGEVSVIGKHPIDPESIKDTEIAYHVLENIHNTEYRYNKVKIEMEYQ